MAGLVVVMLAAAGGFSGHSPRPATHAVRPHCAATQGVWRHHARKRRRARPCAARPSLAPRRPVAPRLPVIASSQSTALSPAASPSDASAAAPAPSAAAPAPAPAGPPAPAPPEPPPVITPLPHRLGVDEGEYYVRPSRRLVAAGPVELNVTNRGQDDHDLAVEAGGVIYGKAELHPGETKQLNVVVPAGDYKLYCTLQSGAHDAAGMHAVLSVQ
jgi:hypothetical protein